MIIKNIFPLVLLVLLISCARQTTPEGGPKDTIFPTLISSKPYNNEKNFKDKVLTFNFSEAVKLKDPKEEIIISPAPPKDLVFLAVDNKVTITTKQKWEDSTTYSIAFRDAVQDVTESNPVENLRLAFSTTNEIDSLSLRGHVYDVLTEKIQDKITVAIAASDTFNIFKHSPTYFTKADKKGSFNITNLKPGSYHLYAFDDRNKNLKVESIAEPFGILATRITLPTTSDSIRIPLLRIDSRPIKLTQVRNNEKYTSVQFNKSLTSYTLDQTQNKVIHAFNGDHKEIHLYHNLQKYDSLPVHIQAQDSLLQKLDTIIYLKKGKNPPIKDPFKFEITSASIDRESFLFKATCKTTVIIKSINFDSLILQIDSTHQYHFDSKNTYYDTVQNRLILIKQIDRSTKLPDHSMKLIALKTAFISIQQDTLKPTTKTVESPKPEELATIRLQVTTNKSNYVIQLLTNDYTVQESAKNQKQIVFRNVPAGEYKIRIYLDKNNNGHWDPGNANTNIPPEPTFYQINNSGKYEFPLRANWDVGPYKVTF